MCGIFGSLNFNRYSQLYRNNCTRGSFAGGSVYTKSHGNMYLKKWKGVAPTSIFDEERSFAEEFNFFLGHTQAPTGSVRAFKHKTTHPFEHGDWIVAHNGVLENDEEIRSSILPDDKLSFNTLDIPVDSAVIPALLHTLSSDDDVQTISDTFNMIKGTFGCWLFSKKTQQVYVVRSGSTIFANITTGDFSSTKTKYTKESLNEGKIYCMTSEGFAVVGEFECDSPFFIF